jgi:hypothetical protein
LVIETPNLSCCDERNVDHDKNCPRNIVCFRHVIANIMHKVGNGGGGDYETSRNYRKEISWALLFKKYLRKN